MRVADSKEVLNDCVTLWKNCGERIAFVPTMGMLHSGHASLIRMAHTLCDRVVVSVYVNPAQFGQDEDLSIYPRNESHDKAVIEAEGGDIVFIPSTEDMYPDGYATEIRVSNGLMDVLCAVDRPVHFYGVVKILVKLCNLVKADVLVLGEKDWQQLAVVRHVFRDLNFPVEVVGHPLVREDDGLAMSSRNLNLSKEERVIAGQMNVVMKREIGLMLDGKDVKAACRDAGDHLISLGFREIRYMEVRHSDTLRLLDVPLKGESRMFGAAVIGRVRIIDNHAIQ